MKYKGFYFLLFKGPMKKVLIEKYDKAYASEIIKKSKIIYRKLIEEADDIGNDNPMAYNEMFALVFVAPYLASEKKIPPETIQDMMRQSLYSVKWYFSLINLNTKRGKSSIRKIFLNITSGIQRKKKSYIQRPLRLILRVNPMRVLVIIELLVVLYVYIPKSSMCLN